MCYEVKCEKCSKRSWEGCGRHVPAVYKRIPDGQHCQCKAWPGVKPGQNPAIDSDKASSSQCSII